MDVGYFSKYQQQAKGSRSIERHPPLGWRENVRCYELWPAISSSHGR
jgi:hypothetical protein